MIERGGLPDGRAVTLRAIVIELSGDVIGSFYLREIALMTSVTFDRKRFSIFAVCVASLARRDRMFSIEWKSCLAVIERRRFPTRHSVTERAVVIELSAHMIRLLYGLKFRLMTGPTVTCCLCVVAIRVTLLAIDRSVRAYKWEERRGMIEGRGLPR